MKRLTADEREPSDCAKRTEDGKGGRRPLTGGFWQGMNSRDETDNVTMKPVGRGLSAGFKMIQDDEDLDEYEIY